MEKYVVYDIFVHFVDDGESIKKETNSWIRFVHSKEEGISTTNSIRIVMNSITIQRWKEST